MTKKKGKGRPSKLNPLVIDTILSYIKVGVPYYQAAIAAGIDYTTFNNWRNQGKEQGSGEYYDFYIKVEQAESLFVKNAVARIARASNDDWKAAAWLLKCRHPESFSETVKTENKTELSGNIKHSGKIDINALSDEQLIEIINSE